MTEGAYDSGDVSYGIIQLLGRFVCLVFASSRCVSFRDVSAHRHARCNPSTLIKFRKQGYIWNFTFTK